MAMRETQKAVVRMKTQIDRMRARGKKLGRGDRALYEMTKALARMATAKSAAGSEAAEKSYKKHKSIFEAAGGRTTYKVVSKKPPK